MYFLARVVKLSERCDCTRRMTTTDEYIDCVEEILSVCQTMTAEEIELVFRKFERGEIETYGRLKTPDILKALLDYDATTGCDIRERIHRQPVDDRERICQRRDREFLSLTEQDLIELGQVGKQENNTKEQT